MNTSPLLASPSEAIQQPLPTVGPIDQQNSNPTLDPQTGQPYTLQTNKHVMQFHDLQTFNHAVQLQQLSCLTPVRSRNQEDEEPPKRRRGRPSKTEQEYLQKWYNDRGLDYQPPTKVVKSKPTSDEDGGPKKRGRKSHVEHEMTDASNLNIMTQQNLYNQNGTSASPLRPSQQAQHYLSSPPYDLTTHSSASARHPRYGAIEAFIDSMPDPQSITDFMTHIAAYARMRVKFLSTPPAPPAAVEPVASPPTHESHTQGVSDSHMSPAAMETQNPSS